MRKSFVLTTIALVSTLFVLFSCTQLTQLFEPRKSVTVVLNAFSDDQPKVASIDTPELLAQRDKPWVSDIEALKVKVSKFSYRYSTDLGENKWATPTTVDVVVDLVKLTTEEYEWLKFEVPNGAVILGIALEIKEATVTINGVDYPVTIPGDKKVIKIPNMNWKIGEDVVLELRLDLSRSIIKRAKSNNGRIEYEYILIPNFGWRWRSDLKNLWAIQGTITINNQKPQEPLYVVLFEGETPTSTPLVAQFLPVRKEGQFYLGKHKKGTYTIIIYDNLDFQYTDTGVSISGRKAYQNTFEHGKTSATTNLTINITK
ncbi:hypothetical protein [Fervidobacterium thailandense]|uniref:DUF4382 domain-containing protein n=1 Tax=Fervidobacterium thailandense TaxID=1008305 RepID=A0A1E3G2U1_9BACT|nr:hypothetical protein [Fervidobacterium thailandense]ODN29978.1 hypothetical protein A4H02_07835 [Fervidobacterium thailandense]